MSRPWQQLPCIRLCPDGVLTVDFRFPAEVEFWLEFNQRHRPDCALIVRDEIRSIGGFASSEEIAAELLKRKPKLSRGV